MERHDALAGIAEQDAIVAREGGSSEPDARLRVADALLARAGAQHDAGDDVGALATLDELLRGDAAGVEFLPHVFANARLARANRLFELGRGDASIAASADLVAKHGDEADPWFRLVVAAALSNQAQSLERLGRPAEAVTAWAELVRRFGASTDAALRVHVASALAAQGDDLEKLGAVAEAIALYRRLVDTFSASEHPDVARV